MVGVNDNFGQLTRRTYIVYADYNSESMPSPCPSTSTRHVTWYVRWNLTESHQTWSPRVAIDDDPVWKECVGPSYSASSTLARNSVRPALAVDPITKDIFVALPQTVPGLTAGVAGVVVHKASHANPTLWTQVYSPPPFTSANHDSWGPAIAVKREAGSTIADIGVTFFTTEGDASSPSKNAFPNIYMAVNQNGGASNWQLGKLSGHPNWVLQSPWGRHNGIWGHPYFANAVFWGSWTDDRNVSVNSEVWGAAGVYN